MADEAVAPLDEAEDDTPLAAEAAIFLALVNVIESNTRGYAEGKIKTYIDCKKV